MSKNMLYDPTQFSQKNRDEEIFYYKTAIRNSLKDLKEAGVLRRTAILGDIAEYKHRINILQHPQKPFAYTYEDPFQTKTSGGKSRGKSRRIKKTKKRMTRRR